MESGKKSGPKENSFQPEFLMSTLYYESTHFSTDPLP